ncbi:MAG: PAS domain S-box protein, partial [Desulfobacula sp.]|nr:PAS domain S-box protein [Desulfobacula sp.]
MVLFLISCFFFALVFFISYIKKLKSEIKDLEQTQKTLEESKKYYQALFHQNRDGFVINWGSGELFDLNPAFAKMLGYSIDEVKQLSFWDLTPKKWVKWEIDVHGKTLLERGYTDLYEKEYIHKDGTVCPIEIQAFLLNKPVDLDSALIAAFVRDITDQKKAEALLYESEERFRSVAETAVDAIISVDSHGKIIFWNRAAQSHFGYSFDEVTGKQVSLIIPDRFKKAHHEGLKRILAGGQSEIIGETIEVVGVKKNGIEFPIELSLAKWKIKENFYFSAIIRNISTRKIMENHLKENIEKLESLFEHAPLAVVHLDTSGTITACNQNLCDILGGRYDEMIGFNLIKSLKDERMKKIIIKTLSGNRNLYNGDYLSASGDVLTPVRAIFAPILSDKGKVTGVIGILEDITEQLAAEKEKLLLESQLRRLQKNEAIGALAGGIAHDFNNILFPIVGFAEMLEEDLPWNSDLHEHVSVILAGAKRAKELVKQILTFSRQVEQDLQPLRPHLIIKEVAKLVRSTIPSSIEIKKFIDPETQTIMADPTQIHQIAMNLITNANYAMQESGGTLT